MAVTPNIRATQLRAFVTAIVTPDIETTLAVSLAAINFPALEISNTQYHLRVLGVPTIQVQNTQAVLLIAIKRGAETKKLRAWTFTMDGHDFYVLSLGNTATYVYDKTTQQWMTWRTEAFDVWRAHVGMNWDNEIVGGDFVSGQIWNIDPTTILDEGDEGDFPIVSYVTGFVGFRGRDFLPCFGVTLVGSQGYTEHDGAGVTLKMSDDMEATLIDMGTIATPVDGQHYDLSWYSLGHIGTPGRIFQIRDDGYMTRIEALEFLASQEQGQQNG